MAEKTKPESQWKWFGNAGHFCCSQWCRFHLCTQVGKYLISTVGEYVHPMHSGGREDAEYKWLAKNPLGEDVGYGRKFETFVFEAGQPCSSEKCGCGLPELGSSEIDSLAANDRKTANENHMTLCRKYASVRAIKQILSQ